jgi:hypothetical protein
MFAGEEFAASGLVVVSGACAVVAGTLAGADAVRLG